MKKLSTKYVVLILFGLVLVSLFGAINLGSIRLVGGTSLKIILNQLNPNWFDQTEWSLVEQNTVLLLRLPRVLLGAVVGAALAACGVGMQALIRNELADPFILGVSSGAGVFVSLDMIFGIFAFLGTYRLSLSAFLGALVVLIIVYSLALSRGRLKLSWLLLSGVILAMIFDGINSMIVLLAPNALGLHNAQFWLAGSLAGARWAYLTLPLVVLTGCGLFLMVNYRNLNALLLGEVQATGLGVNVPLFQKMLILMVSLLAGVTIAISGAIGFVGLICPHFARLLVGVDHRKVIPVAMLLGSLLVVWTDVLARCLFAPEELPLGILTALIGGPLFIFILRHKTGAPEDI